MTGKRTWTNRFSSKKNQRGEGGIRTLGSLLGYGALAKRCFRPLSHLTNERGWEYRRELQIANTDVRRVLAISSELPIAYE